MRIRILGRPRWPDGIHIGLRTRILLLGIAGGVAIGTIYLAGLRIEANSRQIADRFGMLESLSARLSESMLQGREIATQFLKKPNEKKAAAHEETMRAVISELDEIESIAGTLPEQDALRQALSFRAMIN